MEWNLRSKTSISWATKGHTSAWARGSAVRVWGWQSGRKGPRDRAGHGTTRPFPQAFAEQHGYKKVFLAKGVKWIYNKFRENYAAENRETGGADTARSSEQKCP